MKMISDDFYGEIIHIAKAIQSNNETSKPAHDEREEEDAKG